MSAAVDAPATSGAAPGATGTVQLGLLIDGDWVSGNGGHLTSVNPSRPEEIVAEGGTAVLADLDRAVLAARGSQRAWSRTPIHERGAILSRAAAALESKADALGLELSREEGKTLTEGRAEVLRAAQILRYFAAEGDRVAGEHFASPRRGERILVTRKPLGVVGIVTPFNFPIAIPAWKIAPALVHGNAVVWKPASTVPLLAMRFAEALVNAGLPAGLLNLVIGPGSLGTALVQNPGVDAMTFTGSSGVGRALAAEAALRGIPMQGEMGGKNAALVLADADLDLASEQVLFGAFRSTGQKCTATSRLILADPIADEFLERLTLRLSVWQTGDPVDSKVQMGPVISEAARRSIMSGIDTAVETGAVAIAGTSADNSYAGTPGAFIPPTVLQLPAGKAGSTNLAWRKELFGPVLAVRRAATTQEAFGLAEESEFGLSAALFTRDLATALEAIEALDVGILHLNSESAGSDPHVPFGGSKKSSFGPKEQGGAAKDFYTHTTTVYLRG
ncbi:aldehyde dehydrogenase family protein [Pseudarthrobacter cellobiosi]|uniref:aldehyde dehydrogenase family protein n=2 Tax=Pseudarthrobacter TaxID=1742993 RepID=UPI00208E3C08|nr:aldehyde dehydrogenase family protein [Pseudarthrobacter sp. HLT1-5]MCO4255946.1 aldehyde dehydrogenase family protein [Pseudarthrobacter sp. HLT1-5]